MAQKKFRAIAMLLAVLMVAVVFTGCGGTTPASGESASVSVESATPSESASADEESAVAEGGTIVIGGTFTLSGPVAHAGQSTLEGAELAVKYVNEVLGGVNGKQVELKYYDDEYDESKIPQLYEKLINEDKVDLLISPYTSPFLAAAPIVDKYDEIMFCDAADSYAANEQFGQDIVNIQMDESWKGGMWWKDRVRVLRGF
jgi:branched-chain amino acid transport system substrate-binding protein